MKKDSRGLNAPSRRWEGHRSCGFFEGWQRGRTIQRHRQSIPNAPGKEQEVVGVKVIPVASCTPQVTEH